MAIPVLICLAPMLPLIWLMDRYKLPAIGGVLVIVSCFALMIVAGLYFTLEWEIWALQNVDDVYALKTRVETQPFSMGFPSKRTIGTKSQKALVKELWEERSLRTPLYRSGITYDYTLPEEMIIHCSRLQNGVLTVCLLVMLFISYTKIPDKSQLYPVLIGELIALVYFLYKTISPGLKLKLSAKGMWIPKTGLVSWQEISRIYIRDDLDQNTLAAFLCFTRKEPPRSKEMILKIKDLNITSSKVEYAIKNYLSAYNKTARQPLLFG